MAVSEHLIIFSTFVVTVYSAAQLVKRDEGYWITGRGCGLTNPIKYLEDIPQNLDDHKCSFIPSKSKVEFYCDGCRSKSATEDDTNNNDIEGKIKEPILETYQFLLLA